MCVVCISLVYVCLPNRHVQAPADISSMTQSWLGSVRLSLRACVGRRNMVGVYASTGLVMMVLANLGMGFLWGHGAEAFKYNPLGIILFPSLAGLAIGLGFFAAYIIHGVCTDQSTKVSTTRWSLGD